TVLRLRIHERTDDLEIVTMVDDGGDDFGAHRAGTPLDDPLHGGDRNTVKTQVSDNRVTIDADSSGRDPYGITKELKPSESRMRAIFAHTSSRVRIATTGESSSVCSRTSMSPTAPPYRDTVALRKSRNPLAVFSTSSVTATKTSMSDNSI